LSDLPLNKQNKGSLPAAFRPKVWAVGGVDFVNRTKEQTGIGMQQLSDKIMAVHTHTHTHTHRFLVGKLEGKRPLGRPRCRWRVILRWIFRKWDVAAWT